MGVINLEYWETRRQKLVRCIGTFSSDISAMDYAHEVVRAPAMRILEDEKVIWYLDTMVGMGWMSGYPESMFHRPDHWLLNSVDVPLETETGLYILESGYDFSMASTRYRWQDPEAIDWIVHSPHRKAIEEYADAIMARNPGKRVFIFVYEYCLYVAKVLIERDAIAD